MRFLSWLGLGFLIVGVLAVIDGIRNTDPLMIAFAALLITGFLFFEVMELRDKVKFLLGRQRE